MWVVIKLWRRLFWSWLWSRFLYFLCCDVLNVLFLSLTRTNEHERRGYGTTLLLTHRSTITTNIFLSHLSLSLLNLYQRYNNIPINPPLFLTSSLTENTAPLETSRGKKIMITVIPLIDSSIYEAYRVRARGSVREREGGGTGLGDRTETEEPTTWVLLCMIHQPPESALRS